MQLFIPDIIYINKNIYTSKNKNYIKTVEKILHNIYKHKNKEKLSIVYVDENKIKNLYQYIDYKNPKKHLVLTLNNGDFIKRCPGTNNYQCCNYFVINLYINCSLQCHYCFLQFYLKNPIITIFVNTDDLFSEFEKKIKKINIKRIGTGELSDSLLFDPYTDYSIKLIDFFSQYKNVYFEFKTKTSNIDNLLNYEIYKNNFNKNINNNNNYNNINNIINLETNLKNIVAGFSLNSYRIYKSAESLTSPIDERINNARKLIEKGYSVSFHFDPIFIYDNADKEYLEILEKLKENINPDNVAWFSIGSFRYHRDMKDIVRNNFPDEIITKHKTITGLDGKIRYFSDEREKIYNVFYEFVIKKWKVPLYMCMESKKMWYNVFGNLPYNIDNLENIFKM